METIAKPDELLALHDVTAELFDTLREWFEVPEAVTVDLRTIDSAVEELGDPVMIMAMAMRKLQALHLLSTPGVRTTTDVVVAMVQDLNRALLQAPSMRLKVAAEQTDWDAAFQELAAEGGASETPTRAADAAGTHEVDDADPEAERFHELHAKLHEAVVAVVRVSEGEIRYLV